MFEDVWRLWTQQKKSTTAKQEWTMNVFLGFSMVFSQIWPLKIASAPTFSTEASQWRRLNHGNMLAIYLKYGNVTNKNRNLLGISAEVLHHGGPRSKQLFFTSENRGFGVYPYLKKRGGSNSIPHSLALDHSFGVHLGVARFYHDPLHHFHATIEKGW